MNPKTKTTKRKEIKVPFSLWLLRDSYEALREIAIENNRTLAGEINERLKQSLIENSTSTPKNKKAEEELPLKFRKKQPGDKGYVLPEKEGTMNWSNAVPEDDELPEFACPACGHKRGWDGQLCVNILGNGGWQCERCMASGDKKELKI